MRGALIGLDSLLRTDRSGKGAGVAARAESAILAAAEGVVKIGDPELASSFATTLGAVQDPRASDLLWSFVRHGVAREQSLSVITWRKDVRDLARLGSLLIEPASGDLLQTELSSLPSALRNAYGEAALPFLEAGVQKSRYVFVRTGCARELVLAGRGLGFSFIVDAIEGNRRYRMEMTQFVRDSIPEIRGASVEELLVFLKQRAK